MTSYVRFIPSSVAEIARSGRPRRQIAGFVLHVLDGLRNARSTRPLDDSSWHAEILQAFLSLFAMQDPTGAGEDPSLRAGPGAMREAADDFAVPPRGQSCNNAAQATDGDPFGCQERREARPWGGSSRARRRGR